MSEINFFLIYAAGFLLCILLLTMGYNRNWFENTDPIVKDLAIVGSLFWPIGIILAIFFFMSGVFINLCIYLNSIEIKLKESK